MSAQEKCVEVIAARIGDITVLSKRELVEARKKEQKRLIDMSEKALKEGKPLSNDFDLLVQSLVVDELLAYESNFIETN